MMFDHLGVCDEVRIRTMMDLFFCPYRRSCSLVVWWTDPSEGTCFLLRFNLILLTCFPMMCWSASQYSNQINISAWWAVWTVPHEEVAEHASGVDGRQQLSREVGTRARGGIVECSLITRGVNRYLDIWKSKFVLCPIWNKVDTGQTFFVGQQILVGQRQWALDKVGQSLAPSHLL